MKTGASGSKKLSQWKKGGRLPNRSVRPVAAGPEPFYPNWVKTPEEKAQWDWENRNRSSLTEARAKHGVTGLPGLFEIKAQKKGPLAEAEEKMAGAEPVQAAVPAPRPAVADTAEDMDVAAPVVGSGVLPPQL